MYKLVKEIVNYLNEINRGMFTKENIKDFIKDYIYIINSEGVESIINSLKVEYMESKDVKILCFIERLESVC